MPAAVFVYGTLMPERLRWPILAPAAVSRRRASVAGRLWDTGNGWPAAQFSSARASSGGASSKAVPGWLVEVDPSELDALLVTLDEIEGAVGPMPDGSWPARADDRVPPGDYRRLEVTTIDGAEAWAYEALAVAPTWTPITEWADRPEA